jgi:2-octaprenyl-6-methoxyphenol hydroxylase
LFALVRGCGPTGALAALALAEAGWSVRVQDPSSPAELTARQRAYALTHSSRRLLQQLGPWDALRDRLVPFRELNLRDLGSGATTVTFGRCDLSRANAAEPIGWIALHDTLMATLLGALERHPGVSLALGAAASDGPCPEPVLIVAAEGPQSASRDSLAIGCWRWHYRQSCLTAQVQMRGTEPHQAWELFRPEGPMALLPLGGTRVQLVWSASPERCRALELLGPDAFLDHLSGALPERFQPEACLVQPRSFAVGLSLAHRLQWGHTVLVGESAHSSHPVGGQGLNLCWRDVATLHRLALRVQRGRLTPGALPRRYALQRWPDLLLTLAATDLLVRVFSNRAALLLPLRRAALGALLRLPLLRRLSLGVMTDGPCRVLRH